MISSEKSWNNASTNTQMLWEKKFLSENKANYIQSRYKQEISFQDKRKKIERYSLYVHAFIAANHCKQTHQKMRNKALFLKENISKLQKN